VEWFKRISCKYEYHDEIDCVRKEGEGVTIIGLIVWYEIDFYPVYILLLYIAYSQDLTPLK